MKNQEMINKLVAQGYKIWNEKRIYINDASKNVNVEIIKKEGYCDTAKLGNIEMILNGAGKTTYKALKETLNVYYDIENDKFKVYVNGACYNASFEDAFIAEIINKLRA